MRKFELSGFAVLAILSMSSACGSQDAAPPSSTGGSSHAGGATSSGGSGAGGSASGVGGVSQGSGGAIGSGGQQGTGGANGTGGKPGTGGTNSTGSGGVSAPGGVTGSGGLPGTGGRGGPGDAGVPDATPGAGGRSGTGGVGPGAGGTTGPGSGGSTGSGTYVGGTKTPGTAPAGAITVDPSKPHQIVDGFGQADVWQPSSSATMQTLLFDPVNGIGLNLLRIGIESKSGASVLMGDAAIADSKACVKFAGSDCKVWAAPWSPPASMKNNNNVNGGTGQTTDTLKTTSYDAWATLLAGFPATFKQQSGVDLFAVSAQNEPDWNASYEACIYDKTQMVNFINVLGPKLAALNPPIKVLAAEPDNWGNMWGGDAYSPAIIADATANGYVGILATHDYGTTSAGTYARPAPPANNTHHIWETECTPGDTGPITIATMIYAAFSTGGVSGWHYWWTSSLVSNASSPPAQVYALGNFSKYVRPGYYRVDVSGAPTPSASKPLVVAFSNLSDNTVAIVVVNGGSAQTASFFVAGTAWPASVTPYVTTSSSKLAAGTAITVTAGAFTASLDASSVTTFVGKP